MEIGKKLKDARIKSGMTQEAVAEEIQVSRQTISNWENEKSYPDIVSVIHLSDLYRISLDELLKGDTAMLKHLDESTNMVNSNKKLIFAICLNCFLFIILIFGNGLIGKNPILNFGSVAAGILGISILFYQIIRRI
ncbi:MAG: helix-turn-helix domain-containing protein [Lachnospiraceae bacterium]|nr:helix-turn-helix domain-containing protein [Lachnospiraceae bacterium]